MSKNQENESQPPRRNHPDIPLVPKQQNKRTVLAPLPTVGQTHKWERPAESRNTTAPQQFPQWYLKATNAVRDMEPPTFKGTSTRARSSPGTLYYSGIGGRAATLQGGRATGVRTNPSNVGTGTSSTNQQTPDDRQAPRSVWNALYGDQQQREQKEETENRLPPPEHVAIITDHTPHRMYKSPSQISRLSQWSAKEMPLFTDSPSARASVRSDVSGGPSTAPPSDMPLAVQQAVVEAAQKPPTTVVLARPRFSQEGSVSKRMSNRLSLTPSFTPSAEGSGAGSGTGSGTSENSIRRESQSQRSEPDTSKDVKFSDDEKEYSSLHRGSERGPLPDGRGISTFHRKGVAKNDKATTEIDQKEKDVEPPKPSEESTPPSGTLVNAQRDSSVLTDLKNEKFKRENSTEGEL